MRNNGGVSFTIHHASLKNIEPQGRFVVYANVGGVLVNRQHIDSPQEAMSVVDALMKAGALYAEAQEHVLYKDFTDHQRGEWLTAYAQGDISKKLYK